MATRKVGIEIGADSSKLQAEIAKAKAAMTGFTGYTSAALKSLNSALLVAEHGFENLSVRFLRGAESAKRVGEGIERVGTGTVHAAKGFGEFAAAVALGTKAIAAHTSAVGAYEVVMNRVRAARIAIAGVTEGLGGALGAATSVAAVLAIERAASLTLDRAREAQEIAIRSQRSGFSFSDTQALGFAAGRAGKPADFFNDAAKAAGGVDQLSVKLRELAAIRDPVDRVRQTFEAFGKDADKMLPFLGERFGDNITRVREWGLVLDTTARTNVDAFRRDIDSLAGSFQGLTDSIAASAASMGNFAAGSFSSLWRTLKEIPESVGWLTGLGLRDFDARGEIASKTRAANKQNTGAFPTDIREIQKMEAAARERFLGKGTLETQRSTASARIAELEAMLFTARGELKPVGAGGYAERTLALQEYASRSKTLESVKELIASQAELEKATKSVSALTQSAQLSELSGSAKLKAERDIALAQYGKSAALIKEINAAFDVRAGLEGKKISDQAGVDLRTRATATAALQQEILEGRTRKTVEAFTAAARLRDEVGTRRRDTELAGVGFERDTKLRELEMSPAKTLADKLSIEAQRQNIEISYFNRTKEIEQAALDAGYEREQQKLQTSLDSKLISEQAFNSQRLALEQLYQADTVKLAESTTQQIEAARQRRTVETYRLMLAESEKLQAKIKGQFESISRAGSDLFRTMVIDPKNFPKALGIAVRDAALKPLADSFGSQLAALLHDPIFGKSGSGGIAGALGKIFPIARPDGKPDGSAMRPYYVIPVVGIGGLPTAAVGGAGGLDLGKIFGGQAGGGFIFNLLGALTGGGSVPSVSSSVSFPRAGGGSVLPSQSYLVGERGAELFQPSIPGNIIPNHALGGGVVVNIDHIDARGSDEESIRRSMAAVAEETFKASVGTSVQVNFDRRRRAPQTG